MLDFSKNYFELFGLDSSYVVDNAQLSARYRELQRVVHPDRFAGASEQEQRLSMQSSTLINQAYETLRDPVLRGHYLLGLHGIEVEHHAHQQQHDPAFLMEQMELREELADARSQPDPYTAISNIMTGISKRINTLIGQLAICLEEGEEANFATAQALLTKMQFLKKLQQDAERIEAELDERH